MEEERLENGSEARRDNRRRSNQARLTPIRETAENVGDILVESDQVVRELDALIGDKVIATPDISLSARIEDVLSKNFSIVAESPPPFFDLVIAESPEAPVLPMETASTEQGTSDEQCGPISPAPMEVDAPTMAEVKGLAAGIPPADYVEELREAERKRQREVAESRQRKKKYNPRRQLTMDDYESTVTPSIESKQPSMIAQREQSSERQPVVGIPTSIPPEGRRTGRIFGEVAPVPFDRRLDPPPYACLNCWRFGHIRRKCPEPARWQYCVSCGRKGVSVRKCPRCSTAHWRRIEAQRDASGCIHAREACTPNQGVHKRLGKRPADFTVENLPAAAELGSKRRRRRVRRSHRENRENSFPRSSPRQENSQKVVSEETLKLAPPCPPRRPLAPWSPRRPLVPKPAPVSAPSAAELIRKRIEREENKRAKALGLHFDDPVETRCALEQIAQRQMEEGRRRYEAEQCAIPAVAVPAAPADLVAVPYVVPGSPTRTDTVRSSSPSRTPERSADNSQVEVLREWRLLVESVATLSPSTRRAVLLAAISQAHIGKSAR